MTEERIGGQSGTDETAPAEAAPRYEPLDVPPLLPFWLACLLAGFVLAVLIWVSIAYPLAVHQEPRGPLKPLPAAPRLETAPMADLQRYEADKAKELNGSANTVPITVAMQQTAKQGWGPPK